MVLPVSGASTTNSGGATSLDAAVDSSTGPDAGDDASYTVDAATDAIYTYDAGDDASSIPDAGTDSGFGPPDAGPEGPGWQTLANPCPVPAGISLLLTDGTVMVQDVGGPDWWKLTPDSKGSYLHGTWAPLALMPPGYAPLYFASAVLPDGRVIVEGGEYNNNSAAWTTMGAIYDPTADSWTPIDPPAGWDTIGDAQSVVLPDGRFLLANCCTTQSAILDPKTLTWTPYGTGKVDMFDEEGWTVLQNGGLFTVDANNQADLFASELLNVTTGIWSRAPDSPVQLADLSADGSGSHEMGPQMVRPDGTVFVAGATGHTAIYHPSGRWTAGPDFPVIAGEGQLDIADGPAALMPNGHVLMVASAGIFNTPAHIMEFDGRKLKEVGAPPQSINDSSYNTNLLVLPSGEVLFTDMSNDVQIYSLTGHAAESLEPQIDDDDDLDRVVAGSTYSIAGFQFSGLSQAVAYGDDGQSATNYPLVRITNERSGDVAYARTHEHANRSIAPGAFGGTKFDVPSGIARGDSLLQIVANGVASDPIRVKVLGRK